MARYRSLQIAVDRIGDTTAALALNHQGGHFAIECYHHFPTDEPVNLGRAELIAAIEHRATHYQRFTSQTPAQQVLESFQQTLTNDAALMLDHQSQSEHTAAVASYQSQILKVRHQFASLNRPLKVIEPAFQAVIRATNWLLPRHWSRLPQHTPCSDWLIILLEQPLSVCLHCRYGELESLSFRSLSELAAEPPTIPIFYVGANHLATLLQQTVSSPAIPLTLGELEQQGEPPLTAAQHLVLVGLALRRFNQWHR